MRQNALVCGQLLQLLTVLPHSPVRLAGFGEEWERPTEGNEMEGEGKRMESKGE